MENTLSLLFVFLGAEREWKPLRGCEAPEGRLYELRALPGNIVVGGDSPADAHERLKKAIEAAFIDAGSAEKWHAAALNRMSRSNWDAYTQAFAFAARNGQAVVQSTGAYQHLTIDETREVVGGEC